jgi:hypothetical protein
MFETIATYFGETAGTIETFETTGTPDWNPWNGKRVRRFAMA